mgnify:CR=1 FL=1
MEMKQETIEIQSLRKLMNVQKEYVKNLVEQEAQKLAGEITEKEWSLFEFSLFVNSLGEEKLENADSDVNEFKKETWEKVKSLEEYKESINFI